MGDRVREEGNDKIEKEGGRGKERGKEGRGRHNSAS
jgi:hypothetical protein